MKKYFIFAMCCLSITCTLFSQRPAMAQPLEDDTPKSSPPPPPPSPIEISPPIREIEVYVPPPPPREYVLPPSSEIIVVPVECPPTREPTNSIPRTNSTNVDDEPQYIIGNSSSSSVYVSNSIASAQPQVAVQQHYLQKPTAEEALHKLIVMSDVGNAFILSTKIKRRGLWRPNTVIARNHIREMLNIAVFLPSENFAKVHPLMRDIYTILNESVENHSISDPDAVFLSRFQKSNTYYMTLIGKLNEILQEEGKEKKE